MKRVAFVLALLALVALWWLYRGTPEAPAIAAEAPVVIAEAPIPPTLTRALDAVAAPSGPVGAETSSVVLYGFVRDLEGLAVSSATVRALPRRRGEALVARTGPEGEYVLLSVPRALDSVEVSATGYRTSSTAPGAFTSRRARLDFVLDASPGIRGLVRCAGEPASGARVWARRTNDPNPRHGRGIVSTAKSGPDGRFLLELEAPPSEPLTIAAWSGTCGEGSAAHEGGPVTVDLEGSGSVSGQVIDAKTKRPIPSFWISATSLLRDAGGPDAVSVDDERGAFVLGPLAPGPQRLYVASPGYRPESREVEVKVGAVESGVTIALARSAELRGRVTDAVTGQPIAGATVAPAEWNAEVLSEAIEGTTGPDGRYVLNVLPDKRTSVTANARGYRALMHGGVNGRATRPIQLDFALTPIVAGASDASELVGIGAQLRMTDVGVEVAGLVPGGPASSKLRRGDVIVQVDDTPVASLDLGDVVQAIRGEAGSEVEVWVRRLDAKDPVRVTFERARVSFAPMR